jgi:hypothetical protein
VQAQNFADLQGAFRGDAVNLRAHVGEPEASSVHPAPAPSAAIIWSNPLPVIGRADNGYASSPAQCSQAKGSQNPHIADFVRM